MIRFALLAVASLLIHACATASTTPKATLTPNASFPAYELEKEEAVYESVGEHWGLALEKCGVKQGVKEEDIDQACIISLVERSLPETDLVSAYCDGIEDFIDESDCLTMASFAVDLVRRTGSPAPAEFVENLPSKYGRASGEAAILLAKAIWEQCPDGPNAVACRIDEAERRLETPPEDRRRCEALPEDRKIVSCLIIARFVHRMQAGTEKLKGL